MNGSTSAPHAFITLVEEHDAAESVKLIYEDIKESLNIDFIPNMYKAMAVNPEYLETSWKKIKTVMGEEGRLGGKTKDIVALTVSIMSGCDYCIGVYNETVRSSGLDDAGLLELYEVIDLYAGLNRLNIALQTKRDEKPWHGCGGARSPRRH
jgi:AhpD family alkylhydroperoxidase